MLSSRLRIYYPHLPRAVNHLPDSSGKTGLHNEVPDQVQSHGALLRGLQNDGVTEDETDGDGPHGYHEGEVEGHNGGDNAQGPPGVCAVDPPADSKALALRNLGEGDGVLHGLEPLGHIRQALRDVLPILLDNALSEGVGTGLHEGVEL